MGGGGGHGGMDGGGGGQRTVYEVRLGGLGFRVYFLGFRVGAAWVAGFWHQGVSRKENRWTSDQISDQI